MADLSIIDVSRRFDYWARWTAFGLVCAFNFAIAGLHLAEGWGTYAALFPPAAVFLVFAVGWGRSWRNRCRELARAVEAVLRDGGEQ